MTAGIISLGISIFFCGMAFQEATAGTTWNQPDGGAGSLYCAVIAFIIAYRIIMSERKRKQ